MVVLQVLCCDDEGLTPVAVRQEDNASNPDSVTKLPFAAIVNAPYLVRIFDKLVDLDMIDFVEHDPKQYRQ